MIPKTGITQGEQNPDLGVLRHRQQALDLDRARTSGIFCGSLMW
jgi:hypothetical protein